MAFDFDALTTEGKVNAAYVAYYGRAADAEGRAYWVNELDAANGNLDAIIDAFGTSTEAEQRYGGRDPADAVTALYQDLFGRAPDSPGLAFYTGELEAGRITLQSLALDILNGAIRDDATLISNRLEMADDVTDASEALETPLDAGFARFVVAGIDASEQSLSVVNDWFAGLRDLDPPFAALGSVNADGSSVTALPTDVGTLIIGSNGSGLIDLKESDGSAPQRLVVSADDGGSIRVGDAASGLLRVNEEALEAQGTGNTIRIGDSKSGVALLEDGATLSTVDLRVGENARGEMMLTGDGTKATVSSVNGLTSWGAHSYVAIARAEGSYGKLTVDDGAILEVLTPDGDTVGGGINIAEQAGSQGELIVDSASLNLRDTDGIIGSYGPFVQVGRDGTGRLELRNNAEMLMSATETSLAVGQADETETGVGALVITSESKLTMTTSAATEGVSESDDLGPSINVGRDGATGAVTVREGGMLEIIGRNDYADLTLGRGAESVGTVTVTGVGTRLAVRNENAEGGNASVNVGRDSKGSLTFEAGAVFDGGPFMTVGGHDGGDGELVITGSETRVVLGRSGSYEGADAPGGGFLQVGQGTGSVGQAMINDGASMTITTDVGEYTGFQIGDKAGATGTLTIKGTGSSLSVEGVGSELSDIVGYMAVGQAGEGALNVAAGGRFTGDEYGIMGVGVEKGSVGTVQVSGDGSVLDAGGLLLISGSIPAGTVDRDALDLVGRGTASVTVGAGATLRAGEAQGDGIDDIFIGENGTLRIEDGGTVEGDVNNTAGGTYITGNSPGWAEIVGDFDWSGELAMEFAGADRGEYDRLDITGEAVLAGIVTLDFSLDEGLESGDRFTVIEADEGLDMAAAELDVAGLADGLGARTVVTETALQVELV